MDYCLGRLWAKSTGNFIGKNFCQYDQGHKIRRYAREGEYNRYGKEMKHIQKHFLGKSEEGVTFGRQT